MKKNILTILSEYKKRLLNDKSVGDIFLTKINTKSKNIINLLDLLFLSNHNPEKVWKNISKKENLIITKLSGETIKEICGYVGGIINKSKNDEEFALHLKQHGFSKYPILHYSKILEFIFTLFIKKEGKKISEESLLKLEKIITEETTKTFNKFARILQDAKLYLFEKNINPLYIGWPYIEGLTQSQKVFRAPLLLWPINEISRTKNEIVIATKHDEILLNSAIRLSQIKDGNYNVAEFSFDSLTLTDDIFMKAIADLKTLGFKVKNEDKINHLYNLNYYKQQEQLFFNFDGNLDSYLNNNYQNNNLGLVLDGYLGMYNISSTTLYRDYCDLEKVPDDSVNRIFENEYNVEEDWKENQLRYQEELTESAVMAINNYDISQKVAIKKALEKNTIIQGPPGTGKSQTISNLIVNNLYRGERVLFCAEKQDAIKVVYNNMKKIQNYALMITNLEEKESFYQKILDSINNINQLYPPVESATFLNKMDTLFDDIKRYKVFARQNEYQDYRQFLDNVKTHPMTLDFELLSRSYFFELEYDDYLRHCHRIYQNTMVVQKFLALFNDFPNFGTIYHRFSAKEFKKMLKRAEGLKPQKFLALIFNLLNNNLVSYTVNSVDDNKFNLFKVEKQELIAALTTEFKNIDYFVNRLDLIDQNDQLQREDKNYDLYAYLGPIITGEEDIPLLYQHYFVHQYELKHDALLKVGTLNWRKELTNLSDKSMLNTTEYLTYLYHQQIRDSIKENFIETLPKIIEECKKKTKRSITYFFKNNYELIKTLFPVIMVTPDIASQLLPLKHQEFDQLIFDEASQIFIERAIPIIYRANRILVAGDKKQLGPTNFFSSRFDYEGLENSAELLEIETNLTDKSLLDFASKQYNSSMLRFHYRSKYSELINFSNAAFYDNNLIMISNKTKKDFPLKLIEVPDGVWKNRGNVPEAKRVVALIKEIITTRKHQETIGVVTFNEVQKNLIWQYLTEEFERTPELEQELHRVYDGRNEGLFVKNIENIQGDERDIIIFSIGFARDESNKFMQFFGPLSQAGGENRLNVAVTRAKEKIYIVKSFPSSLISEDSKHPGPRYFKYYLEYVEQLNRGKDQEHKVLEKLTTAKSYHQEQQGSKLNRQFVSEVADALRTALSKYDRYQIATHTVQGTYQIDVTIYDQNKDHYVLGIICDDLTYPIGVEQKEYDFYRQKYLFDRGWKIESILSSNWMAKNQQADIINTIVQKIIGK
ncbi:hypothetical protein S100390_v1c07740 [Spiroplasma sp. NBRC 100390]|uniref:AAA domain-containing protein n=1 Tax=unclassified Spiroplasma TaxID=2637901 RepID=UPI00089287AA|nr:MULTISPECIES: AAA domain-containing protein [unclassified Spiroplasma]AOX44110.1 hypothetical protein STU14_v1c07740 [Spiroplasma sp. TU-14]APE13580.1 hypothetical protein S100390_v1c07740 [Spiroplasma sp. NBRC 100390]